MLQRTKNNWKMHKPDATEHTFHKTYTLNNNCVHSAPQIQWFSSDIARYINLLTYIMLHQNTKLSCAPLITLVKGRFWYF